MARAERAPPAAIFPERSPPPRRTSRPRRECRAPRAAAIEASRTYARRAPGTRLARRATCSPAPWPCSRRPRCSSWPHALPTPPRRRRAAPPRRPLRAPRRTAPACPKTGADAPARPTRIAFRRRGRPIARGRFAGAYCPTWRVLAKRRVVSLTTPGRPTRARSMAPCSPTPAPIERRFARGGQRESCRLSKAAWP